MIINYTLKIKGHLIYILFPKAGYRGGSLLPVYALTASTIVGYILVYNRN